MNADEFRKELNKIKTTLPDFVMKYIEELESKSGQKKTIYTVNAIYQHDMGVEYRFVYQGTDPEQAFKNCYDNIKYNIEDSRKNYRCPFDDVFEQKYPGEEWENKHFTGLEIKQMFIDMINNAIENKKTISYNFACACDWDDEAEGDASGFVLNIKEI